MLLAEFLVSLRTLSFPGKKIFWFISNKDRSCEERTTILSGGWTSPAGLNQGILSWYMETSFLWAGFRSDLKGCVSVIRRRCGVALFRVFYEEQIISWFWSPPNIVEIWFLPECLLSCTGRFNPDDNHGYSAMRAFKNRSWSTHYVQYPNMENHLHQKKQFLCITVKKSVIPCPAKAPG